MIARPCSLSARVVGGHRRPGPLHSIDSTLLRSLTHATHSNNVQPRVLLNLCCPAGHQGAAGKRAADGEQVCAAMRDGDVGVWRRRVTRYLPVCDATTCCIWLSAALDSSPNRRPTRAECFMNFSQQCWTHCGQGSEEGAA